MFEKTDQNINGVDCATIRNNLIINNILRGVTMFEKALNRLMRNNCYDQSQYPEDFFIIETLLITFREWFSNYSVFSGTINFSILSALLLNQISEKIVLLNDLMPSAKGKKQTSKKQTEANRESIIKTLDDILDKIASGINSLERHNTDISEQMEQFVQRSFNIHMNKKHEKKDKRNVSSRGEKTIIFPFNDCDNYEDIATDRKRFKKEILENLCTEHQTGHKKCCKGKKSYSLVGFRPKPRKSIMKDNLQHVYPIRMGKCKICGEKFSFLPSFLPREKHFGIEIIGSMIRNVLLFNSSIRSAFETLNDFCTVKSKETIFNWLKWIGEIHPANLLIRAGVRGTGYLHEDEGFEKEVDLRTYSVLMIEPGSMLVWHADYVDHVDEKNLIKSFEGFLEKITFKVIGISKDKWKASTNALKKVIRGVWLGFCHRHCKKNFFDSLQKYQKETGCSDNKVKEIYQEFISILNKSTSGTNLIVRLKQLERREECNHPLLKNRIKEVKENAVHYTMPKKRKGITKTTFAVDNYLKIVKRKLKQVESFRDKEMTKLTFQGMANVRNFVPFMSGAKNAHKSPFELAGGETYGLSWIQAMNIHNAFLFTPTAF